MKRWLGNAVLAPIILFATSVSAAYDLNGIALGDSEQAVAERFPSAHCKPLQWASRAADRRCDDGKVIFGGANSRITFYLKQGQVQAFDVRFDTRETERVAAFLKSRYGAPAKETRQKNENRPGGEIYKVLWEQGDVRAVLTSLKDKRRASLSVSRGDFEEEIYRVR